MVTTLEGEQSYSKSCQYNVFCLCLPYASLGLSLYLSSSDFFMSGHQSQLYDPMLGFEHLSHGGAAEYVVLSQQLLCCDLATTTCSSRHWAQKSPFASMFFTAVPSVRL